MNNDQQEVSVVDTNPYDLTDFKQKSNNDDKPGGLNTNALNKLVDDIQDDEDKKDSDEIKENDSTTDNSVGEDIGGSDGQSCGEKMCERKYLIISSVITFCFVTVASIVAVVVKSDNRLHIVTRTLEIVDIIG